MLNIKKALLCFIVIFLCFNSLVAKEVKLNKFAVYKKPKELNGYFSYVNPNALKGGHVTLYGYDNFDTLNPFSIFGVPPKDIIRLLYLPLFTSSLDTDDTIYGLLAKEFSFLGNNKVKIYLREDAVWQNGLPITAQDVKFTFKTLTENSGSYYKAVYSAIENFEIIDSKTFIITFNTNNVKKSLASLADLPIIPEFFWQNIDFKTDLIVAPIGSGFYFLDDYEFGKYAVFERVRNHFAENLPVVKGMYNFNTIRYEYIKDKSVVRESFKAGLLDLIYELNAKQWVSYWNSEKIKNGQIIKHSFLHKRIPVYQAFVFNLRKEKFQNIKVRQAISTVIDFDWMNKILLHNQYQSIESLFQNSIYQATGLPQGKELDILNKNKKYLREQVFNTNLDKKVVYKTLEERLIAGDKLLKEAGYIVKDNKRINKQTGEQLEFEILVINKTTARLSTFLVQALSLLGVKVNIRIVNLANYVYLLNKYNYDMLISIWRSGSYPSAEHLSYWSSEVVNIEGGRNLSGISNKGVDNLVQGLVNSKTEEDLVAYAKALDRVLRLEYINIPQVYSNHDRILWYDKFGIPNKIPDYGVDIFLWWVK